MSEQSSDARQSTSRRNVQRGRTSPSHSLEDAIEGAAKVFEALGTTRHQRDDAATAMGYKPGSGAANSKVGSLTHFGLLSRSGANYEVSELAQRILTPIDEDERRVAVAEAAVTPSLYSELIAQLDGQPFPPMLPAILQRNYGVVPKGANDVASRFEETLKFAGLLIDGKVHATLKRAQSSGAPALRDEQPNKLVEQQAGSQQRGATDTGAQHRVSRPHAQDLLDYQIPLRAKRLAVLSLPKTIDASDIDRIKSWLDLMADVLTEAGDDEKNSEATKE